MLADAGLTDLFLANQIVGPVKLRRLAELARRAAVRVCVDDADNVNSDHYHADDVNDDADNGNDHLDNGYNVHDNGNDVHDNQHDRDDAVNNDDDAEYCEDSDDASE